MAQTTAIGRYAERVVARQLIADGFLIHALNWRTRWCEIDIVASKDRAIYLVEVKYRATEAHGDGLAYITHKKQRQMQFAAEIWASHHNWHGEVILAAIAVAGSDFTVGELIILE